MQRWGKNPVFAPIVTQKIHCSAYSLDTNPPRLAGFTTEMFSIKINQKHTNPANRQTDCLMTAVISCSIPSLHAPVRQPLFPSHECGQSYAEKTLAACVAAEKNDTMIITEVLIYKAQNHFCRDHPKHIHEHTCIHTQAPAHTSILTIQNLIYTHAYTYVHTHTHTHTHTHISLICTQGTTGESEQT